MVAPLAMVTPQAAPPAALLAAILEADASPQVKILATHLAVRPHLSTIATARLLGVGRSALYRRLPEARALLEGVRTAHRPTSSTGAANWGPRFASVREQKRPIAANACEQKRPIAQPGSEQKRPIGPCREQKRPIRETPDPLQERELTAEVAVVIDGADRVRHEQRAGSSSCSDAVMGLMALDFRTASGASHRRLGFALGSKDAVEDCRRQVAIYGSELVRRVHALAVADALRERIKPSWYSCMFRGSGFAARLAALDQQDQAARATLPVRPPERDEESLGAFVVDAAGAPPPGELERHPSLPPANLARVAEASVTHALPEPVDYAAILAESGGIGGGA